MKRKLTALLLALCMVLCLASGCDTAGNIDDDQPKAEDVTVRVGAMNGPTAMGMVKLMDDAENGKTSNEYEFSLETGADVFAPALAKGELDIAAVPANLASILYNNTDGGVKVIAVNTLGVLYVVERGDTVKSLQDLKGKTIYATGEGAAPEFGLRYILKENGIDADNDLSIRWCADTTEALSLIAADESAVAMLPQPFVTVAMKQNAELRLALDALPQNLRVVTIMHYMEGYDVKDIAGALRVPRGTVVRDAQLKRGVGSTRKRLCDGDWRSGGAQRVCAAAPRTA